MFVLFSHQQRQGERAKVTYRRKFNSAVPFSHIQRKYMKICEIQFPRVAPVRPWNAIHLLSFYCFLVCWIPPSVYLQSVVGLRTTCLSLQRRSRFCTFARFRNVCSGGAMRELHDLQIDDANWIYCIEQKPVGETSISSGFAFQLVKKNRSGLTFLKAKRPCNFSRPSHLVLSVSVILLYEYEKVGKSLIFFFFYQSDHISNAVMGEPYRDDIDAGLLSNFCSVISRNVNNSTIHCPAESASYFTSASYTMLKSRICRSHVYTALDNAMYYRSTTTLMFALNNYSGIVMSADTYVFRRYIRETDIRHTLK